MGRGSYTPRVTCLHCPHPKHEGYGCAHTDWSTKRRCQCTEEMRAVTDPKRKKYYEALKAQQRKTSEDQKAS